MRDAASQQFTPTQLGKSLVTGYERENIGLCLDAGVLPWLIEAVRSPSFDDILTQRAPPGFNIKLARPEFRAKMEEDMKAVAEGRKQKQNVVIEWMQIMSTVLKTCFGQTRQLRSEMENFFQVG